MLERFRGDNATCTGCLAHRNKWAGNSKYSVKCAGAKLRMQLVL